MSRIARSCCYLGEMQSKSKYFPMTDAWYPVCIVRNSSSYLRQSIIFFLCFVDLIVTFDHSTETRAQLMNLPDYTKPTVVSDGIALETLTAIECSINISKLQIIIWTQRSFDMTVHQVYWIAFL